MDVIKVGIIGCGMVGNLHASAIAEIPGLQLTTVSDVCPATAQKMSIKYGCGYVADYREMLKEDLDLISVCTPPAQHCEIVENIAQAKKHVLVEKPLDVDATRSDRIIEVCRHNGVKLGVVFQHRFDTVIQTIRMAIDQGVFGKLLMGTSKTLWYRDDAYYASGNGWRGSYANRGGALMSQSIHYIDLLGYFLGDVEAVSAVCDTLLHNIEVEDTGFAILRFKNGAIGTVEGTTAAYPGLFTELSIFGENGYFCVRNDRLESYSVKNGSIPELDALIQQDTMTVTATANPGDLDLEPHKRQYIDMAAAIREDREPFINGEEGRKAVALIDAIYKASAEKSWITL